MTAEWEEALVRRAQSGDRTAFDELVRRTSRLVYARICLETGDAGRAEDLLQEVLLRACRSLRGLEDAKKFRPWLLEIARNVVADSARHDLRQKRASGPLASAEALNHVEDRAPPPEAEVIRAETRARVLAVLRSLPEEYRMPLSLRYLTGADYETIQMQMGITNGALRGLLHRGLKLLQQRLPAELGAVHEG